MSRQFKILKDNSGLEFKYPICCSYEAAIHRTRILLHSALTVLPMGKEWVFYGVGTSGAMMLGIIKQIYPDFNILLINCRVRASSHRRFLEGYKRISCYESFDHFNDPNIYHVFVDDLICSGHTLERTLEMINIYKDTNKPIDMDESNSKGAKWFDFDLVMTMEMNYNNRPGYFENSHFITIEN